MKSTKDSGGGRRSNHIWKKNVMFATVFATSVVWHLRKEVVDVSTVKLGKQLRGGVDELVLSDRGEKFMYYAPHSGFNNQLIALRNALTIANILNRTLIVPPVLDHHAAWLGSCPKRRVLRPSRLRALVWTRISDLITNSSDRYTSIADIIDISSISPSKVKTIDLRVFLALWCGIDVRASCGGARCMEFAAGISVRRDYNTCVRLLNPTEQSSSVFSVDNDCTSTIWTMNGRRRGLLTEDWKAEKVNTTSEIRSLNILGRRNASVLAFGSLFSTSYKGVQSHIDIETPSELKVMPFSSHIVAAGKRYILEEMKRPYYCAQLRLMDGQFKNHWNATVENFKSILRSRNNLTSMFVMTDLSSEKLKTITNEYQVHRIDTRNDLIQSVSRRVLTAEAGFLVGTGLDVRESQHDDQEQLELPPVRLAMEEIVCSCARLGFSGTHGSTIADKIREMRVRDICN